MSTVRYLHYFKKAGGKNAGTVLLKSAPVTIDNDDPSVFRIQTRDRCYIVKAPDAKVAEAWVHDISYYF